jgi:hypothetical protein
LKCSASINGGPLICLPITVPGGRGSSIGMMVVMGITSKNSGPDFTPDLIHIRRRFTSDLTAVLRMGYLVSTSENNCVHAVTYRHSGERLFEDSIQLGSNVNNFWAIRGASDSRSAFRICAQIQGVIYVRSISRLILRTRSRFGRHAH